MERKYDKSRIQKLAGLINENQDSRRSPLFSNNTKADGILWHPNPDAPGEYEWNYDNITRLVQSLGYEDYEEVSGELTHYTSPLDDDEMLFLRKTTGKQNLQPQDITIGMFKDNILSNFPKDDPFNELNEYAGGDTVAAAAGLATTATLTISGVIALLISSYKKAKKNNPGASTSELVKKTFNEVYKFVMTDGKD